MKGTWSSLRALGPVAGWTVAGWTAVPFMEIQEAGRGRGCLSWFLGIRGNYRRGVSYCW